MKSFEISEVTLNLEELENVFLKLKPAFISPFKQNVSSDQGFSFALNLSFLTSSPFTSFWFTSSELSKC